MNTSKDIRNRNRDNNSDKNSNENSKKNGTDNSRNSSRLSNSRLLSPLSSCEIGCVLCFLVGVYRAPLGMFVGSI